ILLKLNLSDHRSILMDLQVTPTKPGRMSKPYSSHRFIANFFNAGNLKMEVKDIVLKLKNFKKNESKSYQDIQSRKVWACQSKVTGVQGGKDHRMMK
nr:hypothetical protein [Tanacetum cinerariifolium]